MTVFVCLAAILQNTVSRFRLSTAVSCLVSQCTLGVSACHTASTDGNVDIL